MNIEKVKQYVIKNKNLEHKFIFHGSRNQNDEFNGTISAYYPAIFTIISENSNIRSFSYIDLLIGNLEVVD